jgi:hypothetical protein
MSVRTKCFYFVISIIYTMLVVNKIFIIKFAHSVIFWWQVFSLAYILYAGITRSFNIILLVAIASILLNGLLLLLNKGRCPFTTLAEKEGASKGSVTDIFLPDCIAHNIFRVSFPFFITELVLLAIRFFMNI